MSSLHAALLLLASTASLAAEPLRTEAERSQFQRTGRYAEVLELCGAFAQRYPDAVRCERFGTTPEGRPMQLLVATRSGALTPADAARAQLPVVLIQGGIHAGEIDGKDAGFLALRELLDADARRSVLRHQVLLFVPVFNVDGHERFGRWNRPNQRGPEQMGWRTTAQNFNLNRDYLKADSPEMQAMLGLMNAWDPLATIDLHVTDGAQFEHDVSIQVEPFYSGDEALRAPGKALRDAVIARLARRGSLPLPFYPSFVEYDNPASGVTDGVPPPRFSSGYVPLRNRFGMLVETHSWKDYPTRVRITHDTILAVLDQVAEHGAQWRETAHAADARSAALGGTPVALDWAATDTARTIEFRGYEYTRTPSEISGASMTRYDERRPAIWKLALRDEVRPSVSVEAPRGGYLVAPPHAAWVADKLAQHGVEFRRLEQALPQGPIERFAVETAKFEAASFEGHQRLAVTGAWGLASAAIGAGALFVPIAQPRARVAIALLEPLAPDSLLAWGRFNNHFETKEYLEAYVAERVAREMLAADPALKAEFEQRLAQDAAFAADPQARLQFFHRRHASWDAAYQRYPVYRLEHAP
jgi:hypothetical protein